MNEHMLIRYSPDAKGRAVRKAVIYTKNEHGIPVNYIDTDAIRIITHLRNNGFDGYIVGGAVRDLLIGKKPKDIDIVTSAEPAKIKRLFRNSRIIGKRFRLVHIFFGPRIYEVSTFRSIAGGSIGNEFGSMDDDVQRRDFTINALYYDPLKEQVIDYVGGVRDIRNRALVPVIPLRVIFREDPVRMIRAVKYATTTGCRIPAKVGRAMRKNAALLQPVSPSRLTEELLKIINSGNAAPVISGLLDHDLFMYLQPSACSLLDENRDFSVQYQKDLQMLDTLVATGEEVRLGRKLAFLVSALINLITDWNGHPMEVYTEVYRECRRFIMPMNPPRIELEYAIRYCLREGGLAIRPAKSRGKKRDSEKSDTHDKKPDSTSGRNRRRRKPIQAST